MKAFLTVSLLLAAGLFFTTQSAYAQAGARTVSGLAFDDANGNGVYDEGEGILIGLEVFLIDSDGNVIAKATSDENGYYTFPDVPYGEYTTLVQVDKNSYVQSPEFTVDSGDEEVLIPLSVNDDTVQFGPSPLLTAVQEFIQMSNNPTNPKTENPSSPFAP